MWFLMLIWFAIWENLGYNIFKDVFKTDSIFLFWLSGVWTLIGYCVIGRWVELKYKWFSRWK